ncbi:fucose-specific lectin [Aspergillus karnatakaensis]|uniref:fucose-specific lectin FleA n=1 Tax=Aspergillus karnatakaensis TaxID=1810916 RepID=UPI003CCD09C0
MDNVGAQQMRFRCAIAALKQQDKNILNVYCQDINGGIREVTCENGKWSGGTERDVVAHGILGTPIVALCSENNQMTHVFFIGERNLVRHVCRQMGSSGQGQWREGDLNHENIEVAPYSMLAACCIDESGQGQGQQKQHARLYCQTKDNQIQEYGCEMDNRGQRWSKMAKVCRALPGTGMACTSSTRGKGKENCIR